MAKVRPLGKMMMMIPPVHKSKFRFVKGLKSNQDIIDQYFDKLNNQEKFGKDNNGIYFKNEFVITFETKHRLNKKIILKTISDQLEKNKAFNPYADFEIKEIKYCPCNRNIVKIIGNNLHDLMTGSDDDDRSKSGVSSGGDDDNDSYATGSKSTQRSDSGVSGASRNYLTWLDSSNSGLTTDLLWSNRPKEVNLNIPMKKMKVVAVIDTGLDIFLSHKDNSNTFKLWKNTGKKCDGKVTGLYGFNFVSDNNNIFDDHGHGTEVTSVFAENYGWNRNYKLMTLKAFDHTGHAGSYEQACAIYYAIEHQADIIIASWGGIHLDPNVYIALEAAKEKGIKVFAAAGNYQHNISMPDTRFYPAVHGAFSLTGYYKRIPKLENIIPVAGLSQKENDLWEYSNYYNRVRASSGEDVSVITLSYGPGITSEPYEQFEHLRTMSFWSNGMFVNLKYILKENDGTSFAAPKVAGLYLRNSAIPLGFSIPVNTPSGKMKVKKIE